MLRECRCNCLAFALVDTPIEFPVSYLPLVLPILKLPPAGFANCLDDDSSLSFEIVHVLRQQAELVTGHVLGQDHLCTQRRPPSQSAIGASSARNSEKTGMHRRPVGRDAQSYPTPRPRRQMAGPGRSSRALLRLMRRRQTENARERIASEQVLGVCAARDASQLPSPLARSGRHWRCRRAVGLGSSRPKGARARAPG